VKWTVFALRHARHTQWLLLLFWLLGFAGSRLGWWRLGAGLAPTVVLTLGIGVAVPIWAAWQRERWIREAPLPQFLKRKLRQTYPHLSGKDADLVERGLRQFFLACHRSRRQFVAMPSKVVDVLWHEFTLADFTYIWTAEGWLYAAAVLDLYSRRIVGWSMHESMTSQLVADALMMAVWRRGKPVALLHHSDQGSQYTSEHFQQLLREQGITCSMSRAGEVWDNSAMESFFSSLKTERTARKVYRTREQARADVFDYIERFYNSTRRHSTLGYVSPIQFEEALKA
jgi:putative transposase